MPRKAGRGTGWQQTLLPRPLASPAAEAGRRVPRCSPTAPCRGGLPGLQHRGLRCPEAGSALSELFCQPQAVHVPPSREVPAPLADQHTAVPLPPFLCKGRREPNTSYFGQARRVITKTTIHLLPTFTPSFSRSAQAGGLKTGEVQNPECTDTRCLTRPPRGALQGFLGGGKHLSLP